jgi:hypothetical protein
LRGLRRQLDEDERNRIAEAIREHLELAGWRIEPGPGIGGHSQLSGSPTISTAATGDNAARQVPGLTLVGSFSRL